MDVTTIVATTVAIIVPSSAVAVAWGALRQRLISHEALDNERFDSLKELVTEVRDDVKTIVNPGRKF